MHKFSFSFSIFQIKTHELTSLKDKDLRQNEDGCYVRLLDREVRRRPESDEDMNWKTSEQGRTCISFHLFFFSCRVAVAKNDAATALINNLLILGLIVSGAGCTQVSIAQCQAFYSTALFNAL